jgi:hypothetical protein
MRNLELVLACAELKTNHLNYLVSNANHRVDVLVSKITDLAARLTQ